MHADPLQPAQDAAEPDVPPSGPLPRISASRIILGVIIALWLVPELVGFVTGQPYAQLALLLGGKWNERIADGEYYRLLTAALLHTSLLHLGFNAYALYSLGQHIEDLLGAPRFVALYAISALGGSVASYLLNPAPAVGASGAIFGIVGALAIHAWQTRALFGEGARQLLGSMLFIVLINLGLGMTTPSIDNTGHLGGLVAGALGGLALLPRFRLAPGFLTPRLVRHSLPGAWLAAGLLALGLLGMVLVLPPAVGG